MLIGNSLERNSMPGIGHGFRRSLVGLKRFDVLARDGALFVSDGPSWG